MQLSLFSLLVGTAVAGSVSSLGEYQIFESLSTAPAPWILKQDVQVDPDQSVKLRIHLKNQNIASFHQKVIDVSTPDHPEYGRHLSRLEVNDMLAPSEDSFNLVLKWLESAGLSRKATVENDWIIVAGTIGAAEILLQTKYQFFEDSDTKKTTARTLQYSLPASLHSHVDIIAPTIKFTTSAHRSTLVKDFQAPAAKLSNPSVSDLHDGLNVTACNYTIVPECLKALYKTNHFRPSRNNGNELALAGFIEQYAQHDDLQQFLTTYAPEAVGFDFGEILVNGGLNTQDNVGGPQQILEGNLDIQYGLSLAYPTKTYYISTGGLAPVNTPTTIDNEPYLEFLTYLLTLDKIPQTISISYEDDEWTVPNSYANTVSDLFSQIAARGTTVLVASGDSGSGIDCKAVDPSKLLYNPGFPASSPWVTVVGATRYVEPELAVGFSGGGFSNYFPRPAWQDAAVTSYLTEHADPAFFPYYNQSGRAYPDVSAQGALFQVILNGTGGFAFGTSASTPTFAGVVALLNSDRISNGLPPFGFLNPWIYSKGFAGLTDIVGGRGSGCYQLPDSGFPAAVGWDPVTGLGTPDFKKLRFISTGIPS